MDYGGLLRRAWELTWRHRFLWALGLFVPGPTASCSANIGGNGLGEGLPTGGEPTDLSREATEVAAAVAWWIERNLGILIALVGMVVLLALALFVVSIIAQGGMAHATILLARGRAMTLGEAWRLGLRDFWRYLGLWFLQVLVMLGIVLVAVAPLGLLGGALYAAGADGGALTLVLAAALLGIALVLAAVVVAVLLSIAVTLAQRAIVVEGLGPAASLRAGVALLRAHPGPVAFVWLLSVAIGIGVTIALAVMTLISIVPLGLIGLALYAAAGFTAITIAYTVVAVLLVIAASWAASAVVATFVWHYWTLAYLAITGRLTDRLDLTPTAP